jgi:hypothetical protein
MSLVQTIDHSTRLAFDSTHFTMCTSSPYLIEQPNTACMDEQEDNSEEKEDEGKIEDEPAKVKDDPDLEDGDEEDKESQVDDDVEAEQDEDEFERYLFGDDE